MKISEESKRIKRVVLSGYERQACAFNFLVGALGAMTESGEDVSCESIAKFVEKAVENSISWHPVEGDK